MAAPTAMSAMPIARPRVCTSLSSLSVEEPDEPHAGEQFEAGGNAEERCGPAAVTPPQGAPSENRQDQRTLSMWFLSRRNRTGRVRNAAPDRTVAAAVR